MTSASESALDSPQPLPRLGLSGPAEVVEAIPFLLGFRPESSVVLLALAPPRRQLVVTARYDLGAPAAVAKPWFATARREGCNECLVVLYDGTVEGSPLPHRSDIRIYKSIARAHSMTVTDAVAVNGERWWSYLCSNFACCPPEGTPLIRDGSVAAAAISLGMVAASDRSQVVAELASDAVRVKAVSAALGEMGVEQIHSLLGRPDQGLVHRHRVAAVKEIEALVSTHVGAPRPCSVDSAARTLLALNDVVVRDALIASVPQPRDYTVVGFWRELTRCAPQSLAAPPATLYALSAYATGDGARANVGLERALADHPGYRLAQLLDLAVSQGVRPSSFIPQLVSEAAKERRKLMGEH